MRTLVVFTEEISAQYMLQSLLPRLLPADMCFKCIAFEGKQDLKKQLPIKLKGWLAPDTCFVVLCDQDNNDCVLLKKELQEICDSNKLGVLIRIVCRELEGWYFGDLDAIGNALSIDGLDANQRKARYRNPDSIQNPAMELKRITSYQYQKTGSARMIGECLRLDGSSSISFQHFIGGVRRVMGLDNQ